MTFFALHFIFSEFGVISFPLTIPQRAGLQVRFCDLLICFQTKPKLYKSNPVLKHLS